MTQQSSNVTLLLFSRCVKRREPDRFNSPQRFCLFFSGVPRRIECQSIGPLSSEELHAIFFALSEKIHEDRRPVGWSGGQTHPTTSLAATGVIFCVGLNRKCSTLELGKQLVPVVGGPLTYAGSAVTSRAGNDWTPDDVQLTTQECPGYRRLMREI